MAFEGLRSSRLRGFDYDADFRVLHLTFGDGEVYSYRDVDAGLVDVLRRSDSPGRFFNEWIKGKFPVL